MIRTIEKGTTLLVDGPASVTVMSGRTEVLGSIISKPARVVIREGKRLPFAAEEKAEFDISLGENASADEIVGNTIPSSWVNSYEKLLKIQTKHVTVVVLGPVDSGKTSFCTYLVNRILCGKRKVAVLDGDLGQSDIGPPGTIAYAIVTNPVTDLFNLRAKNAFFVGETSPSGATTKVITGFISMKKEIESAKPEFTVINTDGWTEGERAVDYKVKLVRELSPNLIFCIQRNEELAPLSLALEDFEKVNVESPPAARLRDIERRKNLRELGYKKYLRNSKVQSLLLSWLKIEGNELLDICKARMSMKQASKIYDLLGMRPLHISESGDRICVVIGRRRWISSENIEQAEESLNKKVIVTRKGQEEGLLAGIYDTGHKFLGIGVLQEIDYLRKTVKISTPVTKDISALTLGKVKLDNNMREIPAGNEENPLDFTSLKDLF